MAIDVDVAAWFVRLVDAIVGFVVAYLRALARTSTGRVGARRATHRRWSSSSIACGLMLLPLSWRHRALLLPCIAAAVGTGRIPSAFSTVSSAVTVLDVGQGLSVIVETARHRLLYDAGPRFPSGFDLGSAVVVPNLRRDGGRTLDTVVLSHADLDHVGGYGAVANAASYAR